MDMRVQRILQQAGLASRRAADEWIRQGRVQVNGEPVELGATADPSRDRITVDGKPVVIRERPLVYLALHKPPGYTTSWKDRHAEHLIKELVPAKFGRVFPVGRLDRDSEGLILLTNDGQLAHALMHPSSQIEKVYEVWVEGIPRKSHLARIKHGIELEDGFAKADQVELIKKENQRALLRLTLHEGRKREVRRMLDSIGHPVQQLVRVRFGNIRLQGLDSGSLRPLTHREVRELKALVQAGQERTRKQGGFAESRGQKHFPSQSVSPRRSGHSVGDPRRNQSRPHR